MIYNPPPTSTGGLTKLTTVSVVDGSNTAFIFSKQPTYIVSDNSWVSATDNNGGVNWTWDGVNTITMTIPPQASIYGF